MTKVIIILILILLLLIIIIIIIIIVIIFIILIMNQNHKFIHLGVILIWIIELYRKEIGVLVNINFLDTRSNLI